ncbi:MAG: hypothetical protein ABI699_09330 [Caldimonas sp.]
MNYAHPSALTAIRSIRAKQAAGTDLVALDAFLRAKAWDDRREVVEQLKANAEGLESANVGSGRAFDFASTVMAESLAGRLPGIRRLPARTSLLTLQTRLRASIVAEGGAIPVIPAVYANVAISPLKVTALLVSSLEALNDDNVEAALAADLMAACIAAMDSAFLNPLSAGSITANAVPVDSSVTSLAELDQAAETALVNFATAGGSLRSAAWAMPAWLGARLALVRGTGGAPAYPDIGALGGEFAGVRVLTFDDDQEVDTDGTGYIALLDGSLIALNEGPVTLTTSTNAMIPMSTTPAGSSITPVASSPTLVSMFDVAAIAILAKIRCGWVLRRAGAVQVVTGISL